MKNKNTKEEKKRLWEEMLKNNTEQNDFSKPIQYLVFKTIIDSPIMPDIKPIDENELNK